MAYFGNADLVIPGELDKEHRGHSIDKIHEMILRAQAENEKRFGRRFAMVVVPEGTLIDGIDHLSDLVDAHGHYKLNPEVLALKLKEELEKRYGMKTQTTGITYEMRNFPPSEQDLYYARISADVLAEEILRGHSGVESTFKIKGKFARAGTAPIERVSEKRYASYYEQFSGRSFVNPETFAPTDEIGRYYGPLFGKRVEKEELLPAKLKLVRV